MAKVGIEITNLTKCYDDIVAVDDLSLRIPQGEFYGLLGSNGAGKTTTMKILCCILRPTKGNAWIVGNDVLNASLQAKALIGYVPEDPQPYENLTTEEFLTFTGQIHHVSQETIIEQVDYYLDRLDLLKYRKTKTGRLSRGTKKRVAIAAALLHEPQVLILDEPLVGLDPRIQRIVKDMLTEQTKKGCTSIFSTHILAHAEEICSRVGILNHGKLIAQGTLADLQHQLTTNVDTNLEEIFMTLTGE